MVGLFGISMYIIIKAIVIMLFKKYFSSHPLPCTDHKHADHTTEHPLPVKKKAMLV